MSNLFDPKEIQFCAKDLLGLDLKEDSAEKLSKYSNLLVKWNATYNLTSIENPEDVLTLHIADSLALVRDLDALVPIEKCRLMDVGSGGGLPAIPLAIMRPDLSVTMVDAVQKKVIFLRQCIAMCRLSNATAQHFRIEKMQDDKGFDVITSRAFASLKDMIDWTRHLLASNGYWLAMKGKYPQAEIDELPQDVELVSVKKVSLGSKQLDRHLLVLKLSSK